MTHASSDNGRSFNGDNSCTIPSSVIGTKFPPLQMSSTFLKDNLVKELKLIRPILSMVSASFYYDAPSPQNPQKLLVLMKSRANFHSEIGPRF
jgi:hypothetical protein